MKFNFQKFKDWVDLSSKVISTLAILIGGYWAFHQFKLFDTDVANVQIFTSVDVFDQDGDNKLLAIHMKPKNIGKVPVEIGKGGLIIAVRKVPMNLKPGPNHLENLKEIYKIDLIKEKFPDGYVLEPGVEYDDIETFVVPKSSTYAITANMLLSDAGEDRVDHTTIVKIE